MDDKDQPFGVGRLRWVSTRWLERHLDHGWTILDTQPDVHDYIMSHIPGAVYLAEKTLRAPLKGLPAQILSLEMVAGLFGRVGIDNTRPVVVYTAKGGFKGWGEGLEQFMVAYTLTRMNHGEVSSATSARGYEDGGTPARARHESLEESRIPHETRLSRSAIDARGKRISYSQKDIC